MGFPVSFVRSSVSRTVVFERSATVTGGRALGAQVFAFARCVFAGVVFRLGLVGVSAQGEGSVLVRGTRSHALGTAVAPRT